MKAFWILSFNSVVTLFNWASSINELFRVQESKNNIPEEKSLYILKVDAMVDNILKVEYEVYSKLLGQNLINLDLDILLIFHFYYI